ncbi:MAG: Serine/threonine-protein kinase pkn3 [Labilithrix sp.]|nr:Serine/threonine-protein kinase pkn3 [Labilithrix sp.]
MSTARVKPGDVLGGKYKVERVLGAGGMGIVVAAKHIDLGQLVALKFMLREAMTDPSHAERFLREAKSAVQLKSVHTARVLDVGRLGKPNSPSEPYMVMEYLDGHDLDAELHARGPLPPVVAVDYVLQASEALAEAHGLGMVHRDIKLKNLFLTSTVDGRPLVKVLDFGLAKTLGSHGDVSLTATNTVFGSPQYMSPEQMRSAKDVDFRSDIWSVGVCLYELLTGRVPFDAQGVAEICAMVLKDPVPPPSSFVSIPADLEAVVLKCLEKDVSRRYQSIVELAFALESYAQDRTAPRRILHVMQSAQRVERVEPSTLAMAAPASLDAGAKTMNAWDSAVPARRNTQVLTRPQLAFAFAGVALMGILGAGAITMAMRRSVPPSSGITQNGSQPVASPQPLPDPSVRPAVSAATPALTGTATAPNAPASEVPAPVPSPTVAATETPPASKPGSNGSRSNAKTTPPAPTTPKTPPKPPKNGPGSGADYM